MTYTPQDLSALIARREELSLTLQAAASEGIAPPDLVAEYEQLCAQIDDLDTQRRFMPPSEPLKSEAVTLNLAAIQSISFPKGWEEGSTENLPGGRNVRTWRLTREPMARIVIYTRDHDLPSVTADAFQRVLYSEFHNLNRTEIDQLGEVIEGMANDKAFDMHAAYTQYAGNRRAVRIDGIWIRDQMQTIVLCVDVGGTGRRVQQISYLAPKSFFEAYFPEAAAILQSIVWHTT